MPGIFGGLFDLDHDGEMSGFERGLEFMFLDELTSDKDECDYDDEDYDYLERYGENYFQAIEGATPIDTQATINSGYLEQSNISVVTEMVNMITISRAYETNQKVVQTYDRILDTTVNQIGRL